MADQPIDYAQQTGSEDPNFANVQDSTGDFHSLPLQQVPSALSTGQFTLADPKQIQDFKLDQKYGSPDQQAIGTLEEAGRSGTFGLSTGIEKAFGAKDEDILGREAALNPVLKFGAAGVGLAASSLIPGVGEENVISHIGQGLSDSMELGSIGSGAAKLGTAGAILSSGDEISHMIANDPNQSFESAAANIGLSAVLGGVGGAALGSISPAFEKLSGGKVGQFIEDFKNRIQEHVNNPDPVQNLTGELQKFYGDTMTAADEVYGPDGLKKRAVDAVAPELNSDITGQALEYDQKLASTIDKMTGNRKYPDNLVAQLEDVHKDFQDDLAEAKTSGDIFDAMNDAKRKLQQFYPKKPIETIDPQYSFVQDTSDLSKDFKSALENTDVWGRAGEIQQTINKAFSEFKPSLDDFHTKFTSKLQKVRQIEPAKVQTYYNTATKGGANAITRQKMLGNFIVDAEKYRQTIGDTYAKVGEENPIPNSSLNAAKASLDQPTNGSKAADVFIKKGLSDVAGKGLGAAIGASVGGGWGAMVGEHALGPFLSSILPSLVKPFVETESSALGAKSAADYGVNVVKGNSAAIKAAKILFKSESEVIPNSAIPKEKEIDKLDKSLKEINKDPQKLLNVGGHIGHYLPNHATAAGSFSANAVNYLESQRPRPVKTAALDPEAPLTNAQKADWARTLSLAQMPIVVMQHIKDGTLLPSDVQTIRTLYPSYYNSLVSKITDEMIDHISKDGKIPYKMRQSLSLFVGNPLDSSLSPQSIQAAQGVFAAQKAASGPPPPPKRGTGKMGEIANQYRTSEQSAQARQSQPQ